MKKLHGLSGKFAVVAALTTVTMFGTGYAAWNFSQTAVASSKSNTHIITTTDPSGSLKVSKLGDTTVTADDSGNVTSLFYLIMDQGDSKSTEDDVKEGLYFSTSNDVTNKNGDDTVQIPDEAKILKAKFTTITLTYKGSGAATQEKIKLTPSISYTAGQGGSYNGENVTAASYNDYITVSDGSVDNDEGLEAGTKNYTGVGSELTFTSHCQK